MSSPPLTFTISNGLKRHCPKKIFKRPINMWKDSHSILNREIQIKLRDTIASIINAKFNTLTKPNSGGCVEKSWTLYITGGIYSGSTILNNCLLVSHNVKFIPTLWPSIPCLHILWKEMSYLQKYLYNKIDRNFVIT